MKVLLRAILFLDALLNLLLGLVLVFSPSTTLFSALQLPQPQPALFGQLLGVVLLGLASLLVQAAFNGQLTVAVARTMGQVNLVSAVLIVAWLLFFDLPVQGAGKVWLPLVATLMVIFAVVQIPAAKKVRVRERVLREEGIERERKEREQRPVDARQQGAPDASRHTQRDARYDPQYNDVRREPGITPPPGYGPENAAMNDPDPTEPPPAHHARQNPYS